MSSFPCMQVQTKSAPPPPPPTVQQLIDEWQQHQNKNDKVDFKEHPAVLRDPTAPFSMGPNITGGKAKLGGLGTGDTAGRGEEVGQQCRGGIIVRWHSAAYETLLNIINVNHKDTYVYVSPAISL